MRAQNFRARCLRMTSGHGKKASMAVPFLVSSIACLYSSYHISVARHICAHVRRKKNCAPLRPRTLALVNDYGAGLVWHGACKNRRSKTAKSLLTTSARNDNQYAVMQPLMALVAVKRFLHRVKHGACSRKTDERQDEGISARSNDGEWENSASSEG